MSEEKERLHQVIRYLPLDKWQYAAAEEGIERLSDEKAEEIANRLETALVKLPGIVEGLKAALAEAAKEVKAAREAKASEHQKKLEVEPAELTPVPALSTDRQKDEVVTKPIVSAIFREKSQIDRVRQQLIEQKNISEKDIYLFSLENDPTPVELEFDWLFLWVFGGLFVGFGLDLLYLVSPLITSLGIVPAALIPVITAIFGGAGYIYKALRESAALKKAVMSLYKNHLQANEFLLIVETTVEKRNAIQQLMSRFQADESSLQAPVDKSDEIQQLIEKEGGEQVEKKDLQVIYQMSAA